MMQFREHLSDRQAAEAVRARIDWKYLLGLALTDPGFDHSVLCEFRDRVLAGHAEEMLLDKLLERCRACGVLKAGGKQRTDATHILAAIRGLNRLELVAETLRAALNDLAVEAPQWLRTLAPPEWYRRYSPSAPLLAALPLAARGLPLLLLQPPNCYRQRRGKIAFENPIRSSSVIVIACGF
jgi:transposase-like protein DUF772